jgi:hypothetical protein
VPVAARSPDEYALVADGALTLTIDESCAPLTGTWIPTSARRVTAGSGLTPDASIVVVRGDEAPAPESPDAPSTLRIGRVRAWLDNQGGTALMIGSTGTFGQIDRLRHRARLEVRHRGGDAAAMDLQPMLTIAAAILLGRIGRILLHAGAVVAEDGRAWLVVGDARSGKSTTCISLAASGWALLSDDQVVLQVSQVGDLSVEGWLRPLHLDEGWGNRVPTGTRKTVATDAFGLRAERGPIELAGTLHTAVVPEQPTRAVDMSAGAAFVGLVRQSPWLLADRPIAPAIVEQLSSMARLPRFALSLGRDTFGEPGALRDALLRALERHGTE